MDLELDRAARALSSFDPLAALPHIALRDDPPALALRGVAMAQLGEYGTARKLLRRAGRAFGAKTLARARCAVAAAEIALASRDLREAGRELESAARELAAHGDRVNARSPNCKWFAVGCSLDA